MFVIAKRNLELWERKPQARPRNEKSKENLNYGF